MKRVAIASVSLLTGCTFTISTLPVQKVYHKPVLIGKHQHHHKVPTTANSREMWWIENYHALEEARGNYTIPDDFKIRPLPNGQFQVPNTVIAHYQDLLLAPTPTP